MRTLACILAAVVPVVAFTEAAQAQSTAYATAFDELYSVNLSTRQATFIGTAGNHGNQTFGYLKGLSFNPNRTLHAISDSLSQKPLVTLNTTTGAANFIAPLNVGSGTGQFNSHDFGATFTCSGQMWVSSATTQRLWKVDAARGLTEQVGSGTGAQVTGLVARGETLYAAGGRGNNTFYRINTTTGVAEAIGPFGIPDSTWISSVSMSFDENGALWAVINYVPPAPGNSTVADWADLARINRNTGAVTILGPITGPERLRGLGMAGFAAAPAPCPSNPDGGPGNNISALPVRDPLALLVLGAVLAGFGVRRLRRQA